MQEDGAVPETKSGMGLPWRSTTSVKLCRHVTTHEDLQHHEGFHQHSLASQTQPCISLYALLKLTFSEKHPPLSLFQN